MVNKAIAYVDGSYNPDENAFSYGCLLVIANEMKTFSEAFYNSEMSSMRNVAGEIVASTQAMLYCVSNNITELDLYYDYKGIECWCTGEWKTNKVYTQQYKDYYDSIKDILKVNFKKVKSHSGDKYNDEVDILAKKALGLI